MTIKYPAGPYLVRERQEREFAEGELVRAFIDGITSPATPVNYQYEVARELELMPGDSLTWTGQDFIVHPAPEPDPAILALIEQYTKED